MSPPFWAHQAVFISSAGSLLAGLSTSSLLCPPSSLNEHWPISPGQNTTPPPPHPTTPAPPWPVAWSPGPLLVGVWWARPRPCTPPLRPFSQHPPRCFLPPDHCPCCSLCSHFTHHGATVSLCDGPPPTSPNSPSWGGLSITHMPSLGHVAPAGLLSPDPLPHLYTCLELRPWREVTALFLEEQWHRSGVGGRAGSPVRRQLKGAGER